MADTNALVKAIATNWHGALAPRVRMLPSSVPYTDLDLDRSGEIEELEAPESEVREAPDIASREERDHDSDGDGECEEHDAG